MLIELRTLDSAGNSIDCQETDLRGDLCEVEAFIRDNVDEDLTQLLVLTDDENRYQEMGRAAVTSEDQAEKQVRAWRKAHKVKKERA